MKNEPSTKSIHPFFGKKLKERSFAKTYAEVSPLMDIALAIAETRNKAGLSQLELAKKLRTTQSVISRVENGNQNLSMKMLAKIARVLGCVIEE